jgi:hypothetical protein
MTSLAYDVVVPSHLICSLATVSIFKIPQQRVTKIRSRPHLSRSGTARDDAETLNPKKTGSRMSALRTCVGAASRLQPHLSA